ncbi:MAG TPA: archaemetzincin family Zn-dependent metalloprotease [Bryobacteraceae bacterium]|nr:archaemetzincin family Zn-dependent metalloprotease [Bryobacteraceae bacterium]HPT25197.1 archaemetzincin family Zn-dependent metalloprotease [Bryobacteraceae bacterium]
MAAKIHILPVSPPAMDVNVLDRLSAGLASVFRISCHVSTATVDAAFAFDTYRGQTHSTAVLARLAESLPGEPGVLIGVTDADLYVPILTFVFGEAQLSGRAAIVSTARLRDEFYGLPPDPVKLGERLLKEAVHEIGHTRGLGHCDDWQCVMVSSHRVERLDLKSARLCASCRRKINAF